MEKKKLKSEVFELLRTFSKPEMKKFGEFLNSPFHNKSNKLVKLFSFIRKFHPDFDSVKLTLEEIHNYSNPATNFLKQNVRNDLSDLYSLSLHFLHINSIVANSDQSHCDVLIELNKRKTFSLFKKYVSKVEYEFKMQKSSTDIHFDKFKVYIQVLNSEFMLNHHSGKHNSIDRLLELYQDVFDNLASFAIAMLTPMLTNIFFFNFQNAVDIKRTKIYQFLKLIIKNIDKSEFKFLYNEHPIFLLYIGACDMFFYFDKTEKYYALKGLFLKLHETISEEDKVYIIMILVNYCIFKERNAKFGNEFSKERLSLYNIILEKGLYKYGPISSLQPLEFIKMIALAIKIGEYKWISNLVCNHIDKLHIKDRSTLENLANAYLALFSKRYEQVSDYLNQKYLDYKYIKFNIKDIQLMLYYENSDLQYAIDLIKPYKKTVINSDIIQFPTRLKRKLFLDIVLRMIMLKESSSSKKIDFKKFRKDIENSAYSKWLTEKLEELIKEKGIK